jgi:hypothetical protein
MNIHIYIHIQYAKTALEIFSNVCFIDEERLSM